MYATEVDGKNLTLGVSGMLWEGSLVMVDQETESLWSHLLGEAMRGPLVGKTLEMIPSTISDWSGWKLHNPETTLVMMERSSIYYRRESITPDSGLIIGLAAEGQAASWTYWHLNDELVINDTFNDQPIVVVYDRISRAALIFKRTVAGRELTFESREGRLTDRETETEWDLLTGIAKTGPLQGKQLQQIPAVISDDASWMVYHANTRLWQPPSE